MKASLPKEFYRGSRKSGFTGGWQGKYFYPKGKGINIFRRDGKEVRVYPFKYYLMEDGKTIAVDYDVPSNPWWLRLVLDELTPRGKGKYLGRLNIRIFGLKIGLAKFYLKK